MEEKLIGFRDKISAIYNKLSAIDTANNLYDKELVVALEELKDLNIASITEDFKKGNYLGNRKIDIDLSLNNNSTTSVPTYQKVNIILVDGTVLEMPFDNGSGGIIEFSSHGDIKNFIVNHPYYELVDDTEIVLLEAFADTPAMIRFRDADGKSSNIERVELFVYNGVVKEPKVNYFWAKTTSALQTLANRIGDIIKLGNNFDPMVKLSDKTDELVVLQTKIPELMVLYTNLNELLATKDDALAASQSAEYAFGKALIAEEAAELATQKALVASQSAETATQKLNQIQSITVQGQTLQAGQSVSVQYNQLTNKFTFAIPQGLKGDKGDSFTVNSIGTYAQRALYDNQVTGYSFLAFDVVVDGSTIPHIYFKKSATAGDWSFGVPFGRGEKGEKGDAGIGVVSIARTSGNGTAGQTDIYTITLSDSNTHEFSVYNGKDSDINSSDLIALQNNLLITINQKLNISDVVNNLTSSFTDKALSAAQGKVLKDLIDSINTLLSSDDMTLDQMQEIVNYIKQNKADLQNLDLSNIAETLTLKHFTATLKTKLDGIATGANLYTHPIGDGNLHIPANGTVNNGKFLKSGATAGSYSWADIPATTLATLGVTATAAELNKLDGATVTTAELNILDGCLITVAQLNYLSALSGNVQTQLNAKAPLASPALTGTPTAPTPAASDNTTKLATTAFVMANVANANAALAIGAVGSVAFLSKMTSGGSIAAGETLSGASLRYAGISIAGTSASYSVSGGQSASGLAGTWKALGYCKSYAANWYPSTMWLRIA
ncbi:MAG: hypothetical protein PHV52_00255 [Aliarcobacter sp.]|nr:hypothetical protein [Aliarcobacter sp.]